MATNERPWKWEGENRRLSIDMRPKLDDGELVSTVPTPPTLEEVGSNDLTISDVQVNTVAVVIDGREVPAGQAVQAMIAGGSATSTEIPKRYNLLAKCNSNSTPQQSLEQPATLDVKKQATG